MANSRDELLEEIQAQHDEIIELCLEFIRKPSPNPPGDTSLVAQLLTKTLTSHGLPIQVIADQHNTPNLISSIQNGDSNKSLLFLGHMDTYPEGDKSRWTKPPFGGIVENECIYGRGAGDMKAGLTALLTSYLILAKTNLFNGRLTLLAVSDEENFSPHGARYVMRQCPELLPNAVLCGEPTGMDRVAFGEKGMVWIESFCHESSGHGALALDTPNAIEDMVALLMEITQLRTLSNKLPSDAIPKQQLNQDHLIETLNHKYYSEELLSALTVNFGLINGGWKINMIADYCRSEIDIRLPPGLTCQTIIDLLDNVFSKHRGAQYNVIQMAEPNWSDPSEVLFNLLGKNIESLRGYRPRMEFDIPASDARLFRTRGIPSALYGPRINNPGAADENIMVSDLIDCVKVFSLTAHDFLS